MQSDNKMVITSVFISEFYGYQEPSYGIEAAYKIFPNI